jgi:pimeloyl-ACP methyl ester carboxylesterase
MPKLLFRKAVSQLARGLDRAFAGTALNPPQSLRQRSRAESLDHAARMRGLSAIASFYDRPEFLTRENALLPRPPAIAPQVVRVRAYGKTGEVLDLHWPSAFEPLWSNAALLANIDHLSAEERAALGWPGDSGNGSAHIARVLGLDKNAELREKYLRASANQTARARWFRHAGSPRPCVVLLHGYMSGSYAIEERMWPVSRLFRSGLDVVMTVLPFHGARRSEARGYLPPAFPSSDPRFTIEGFRQMVFDQRALFGYLLQDRVASLGVMGMSLGGYSAALLATLESNLQFAVLFVPLAAIEEFAHRNGRMVGTAAEQVAQRDALRRAQRPISPFARPALLPGERVIVVAGEADQVTGLADARRLADHFGAELSLFHGGHLLHAGREQAFAPVWRLLREYAGVNP